MASLTAKLLQSKSSTEAQALYSSVKGALMRSHLKKKVIESQIDGKADLFAFLLRPETKSPTYLPPNPDTYLQPRMAKWQQISNNLAKMDTVILKEYRERRAEFKIKAKKNNNPF